MLFLNESNMDTTVSPMLNIQSTYPILRLSCAIALLVDRCSLRALRLIGNFKGNGPMIYNDSATAQ